MTCLAPTINQPQFKFYKTYYPPAAINTNKDCKTKTINTPDLKHEIIKSVALSSLKELAISLVLAGITCAFVATPIGMATVLGTAVAVVAINTLIRSGIGALTYKTENLKKIHTTQAEKAVKRNETVISFLQYLAPISFSVLDLTTRDVLVHEGGHALAATLLYASEHSPTVEVMPLEGGATTYFNQTLTPLGNAIGEKASGLIVSAAGAAASILFAAVNLGVAHLLKDKCPELSRYLNVMAIASIAQHALYAISALWASAGNGHDFLALWVGGIHPVASVVTMVAIPLLVKGAFFTYDYVKGKI